MPNSDFSYIEKPGVMFMSLFYPNHEHCTMSLHFDYEDGVSRIIYKDVYQGTSLDTGIKEEEIACLIRAAKILPPQHWPPFLGDLAQKALRVMLDSQGTQEPLPYL